MWKTNLILTGHQNSRKFWMKIAVANWMALQISADYSWAVLGFGRNTRKFAAQESEGSSRKWWEAWAQWLDSSPSLSQPQALFGWDWGSSGPKASMKQRMAMAAALVPLHSPETGANLTPDVSCSVWLWVPGSWACFSELSALVLKWASRLLWVPGLWWNEFWMQIKYLNGCVPSGRTIPEVL